MTQVMNGVIRKSDGILIRYGLCDFTQDGSFNVATEEQHEAIGVSLFPDSPCNFPKSPQVTHWTGSGWELINWP